MHKIISALFLMSCLWVFTAGTAQAGIIEFLFPSLRDPDLGPSRTLQAPFADIREEDGQEEKDSLTRSSPENAISLNQPHRNSSEINNWLVTALSEALTFETNDTEAEIKEKLKNFSASGKEQYVSFLKENNIIKVAQSKKFYIRSFAEELPLLLNEGAVEGSYRWLYEVPMMVSYMDRNMGNYKDAEPVNQRVVITVQVGRHKDAENEIKVLIERWSARVERLSKK